jgi:hypothetical protein
LHEWTVIFAEQPAGMRLSSNFSESPVLPGGLGTLSWRRSFFLKTRPDEVGARSAARGTWIAKAQSRRAFVPR